MANKPGEVRLTAHQAQKTWDRAFATTWHEITKDHPSRSALERFVRAGYGSDEVRAFVETGVLDVTVGMPKGTRYQQVAEGTEQTNPHPDPTQSNRMAQLALQHNTAVAGSV